MIDVHTHLHPPRLFAAIRRWFAERSTWRIGHPTEPAAVAATLRAHGVERFVFCSYAHKPGMARELNAWLAQASRELGGYGVPLATVHLGDPGYVADFNDALEDGCIGLKLHEDVQRLAIEDERFTPVFQRLGDRGFVLAHVGPIPWRSDHTGPQRVERVLQRHPRLRVVVAHMGADDTADYLRLMPRYPNLYLDTTMAFSTVSPMRIDVTAEDIESHADRILYGTDYPNTPYPYESEATGLRALGLSARAMRQIFRDNAMALLPAS